MAESYLMKEKVELTFIEEVLGTQPASSDIHRDYIVSKLKSERAKDGDSIKILRDGEIVKVNKDELTDEEIEEFVEFSDCEKGVSIFNRDEQGRPYMYDYQLKGFFKDACKALKRSPGSKSNKLRAYKQIVDGCIFITERKVFFQVPEGAESGWCTRPLRASTPQGERVSIKKSETLPAGTKLTFTIATLHKEYIPTINEWLTYGGLRGIGEWRNSGKGRFTWKKVS